MMAKMKAPSVSVSVAPPLSRTRSRTGRLSEIVLPKSKRATWPRYSRYWTISGRSMPRLWRRTSSASSLSLPPNAALTGSPGATLSRKKTSVSSTHIMGMTSMIRIAM